MPEHEIRERLKKHWQKEREYSTSEIISILQSYNGKRKRHRNTITNWREIGLKIRGRTIYLRMSKTGGRWYARGCDIIDFLVEMNAA